MNKQMRQQVRSQIRSLEQRTQGLAAITRLIIGVQIQRYAEAEKLRQAAIAVVRSQWEHRCKGGVGGCTAVSATKLGALAKALEGTTSFKMPRVPAGVAKLVGIKIAKGSPR